MKGQACPEAELVIVVINDNNAIRWLLLAILAMQGRRSMPSPAWQSADLGVEVWLDKPRR